MTGDVIVDAEVHDGPQARRRRPRGLIAGLVVLAIVIWLAATALTGASAYLDLRAARGALTDAEGELRAADLSASQAALATAVEHAERSSERLSAVHLAPLRIVPFVAPNLRAAQALSDAARDVGRAGGELLGAAADIVHGDQDAGLGEISTDYLTRLAPPMRALADELASSTSAVSEAGSPALIGPVDRARTTYLRLVEPVLAQAATAADLAEVMPAFLGREGPRTYLVGAASLSELRGSSGLLGSVSLLRVDDGEMSFGEFVDIEDLEPDGDVPAIEAPSPGYADRYERLGALRFWRNANLSADFPTTAEVLLRLWERDGREPLDGVIVADAVAYERIVERSGPIEVPGVTTLTPSNTRRFVALDAYAAFEDDEERKRVLGAVAASAFARVFELLEDDDVPATVEMLAGLTDGGHLRIFARDAEVQAVLERAGVGGQLPDEAGEFGAVVVNNVAGNKVDVFTSRRTEHRVALLPDGRTRAELTATFANEAPRTGLPRHVLGPWAEGAEAGENRSLVTLLCGPGCQVTEMPEGGRTAGREGDLVATDLRVSVPAGEERRVAITTETPDGWRDVAGGAELVVGHRPQPTLTADELRIVVEVPEGFEVASLPEGAVVEAGEVVWRSDDPDVATRLHYRFVPVE